MTNLCYITMKHIKLSDIYVGGKPVKKKIYIMAPDECLDIVDGKFDFWKWLMAERTEPVLDEVEKRYLGRIIKPFREQVCYIAKREIKGSNKKERITIVAKTGTLYFPIFAAGAMYRGMKLDKEYRLEELGL